MMETFEIDMLRRDDSTLVIDQRLGSTELRHSLIEHYHKNFDSALVFLFNEKRRDMYRHVADDACILPAPTTQTQVDKLIALKQSTSTSSDAAPSCLVIVDDYQSNAAMNYLIREGRACGFVFLVFSRAVVVELYFEAVMTSQGGLARKQFFRDVPKEVFDAALGVTNYVVRHHDKNFVFAHRRFRYTPLAQFACLSDSLLPTLA